MEFAIWTSVSRIVRFSARSRSEEHTSELQSRRDVVCRLLLENKNVHTMFHYQDLAEFLPFLLLDYYAPSDSTPASMAHAVLWHPHRSYHTPPVFTLPEVDHPN